MTGEYFVPPVEHSIIENTMGSILEIPNPTLRILVIESLKLALDGEYLSTIVEHPDAEDPQVNSDLTAYIRVPDQDIL